MTDEQHRDPGTDWGIDSSVAERAIRGVVTGGRYVDPETGTRYDWPDTEPFGVENEPQTLGPEWQSLGYVSTDEVVPEAFKANQIAIRRLREYDDAYLRTMGFADSQELPGQWDASDFLGGDPDERSYAERGWVDDFDCVVIKQWGSGKPIRLIPHLVATLEFDIPANPEVLELLFGQPLIPLCDREIPAEGQE